MASELFDFGVDFGLTFFEPPSKKKDITTGGLTQEEYLKGNVDFYDQSLGQTLGTGIDIRFADRDKDEDEDKDVDISSVGGGSDDQSPMSFAEMESVFNKNQISSANIYDMNIGTYGEALSKAGFADKTPFNVFGQDIYTASVPKTAKEAKEGLERFVSKQGLIDKAVKTGARMMGMNPLISGTAYSFVNGTTVDDPLGNPSFRPNHFALGAIHDINMSIQYDNINEIQQALRSKEGGPRGFVSYINGQLVSRAPGKFAYSGTGAIGLDQQTLQRIDALSKGFVPSSYDYKNETGERGTPTGKGGMYDSRGVYHDINGSAPIGPRSASEAIGKSSGLGTEKIEDILAEVRADKNKNLNEEIAKAQAENFDDVQKAQQETVQERIQEDPSVTNIPTYTSPTYSYEYYTGDDDNQSDDSATSGEDASQDMGFSTRYGGQIGEGMQEGGPAGFIGGPPEKYDDQTTIADDIPLEVKEGTFVINAPAVEYAGSDDIADMLRKAYEKAGESIDKSGQTTTIPSREQIDIMISRGEVVVPPKIAKIIGYDRLEKINNRGKKEVARRKRAGDRERPQARQANEGGFINKDESDQIKAIIDEAFERKTGDEYKKSIKENPELKALGLFLMGVKSAVDDSILVSEALTMKHKDNKDIYDIDRYEDTLRHILIAGYSQEPKNEELMKKYGFAGPLRTVSQYFKDAFSDFMDRRELKLMRGYDPSTLISQFIYPTEEPKKPFMKASPKNIKESEIDLHNNKFGRVLRKKFPNKNTFQQKAFEYVEGMIKNRKLTPVNGKLPKLSVGYDLEDPALIKDR